MASHRLTFDLVLATVDRTEEVRRFLDSLASQSYERFRLVVADQNPDDRLCPVLAGGHLDVLRIQVDRGLSRARNAALGHVTADVVAFPDDDCVYPSDLLALVAQRFASDPQLDGLTGRAVGEGGRELPSWKMDAAILSDDNLWNRAISFTIFLRSALVAAVGAFDEELGLGSGAAWSSGEETDYLVRAVRSGARIGYDPSLTVAHDERPLAADALRAIGHREGASVGYILRKHRYPARVVTRMLVRPAVGALLSLLRGDLARARYRAATLRGRVVGLRRPRPV